MQATDSELMKRIAAGDEAAFGELHRRYCQRVFGFAFRMLGSREVAEDVTQEAFLALIEKPMSYRPERSSMITYLCAIARNHILWHLRRSGHTVDDDQTGAELVCREAGRSDSPLAALLDQELTQKVSDALERLPVPQKECLVLREYEDLSYREIAVITEVELGVVKMRIHRARKALLRQLKPYITLDRETCYEVR